MVGIEVRLQGAWRPQALIPLSRELS